MNMPKMLRHLVIFALISMGFLAIHYSISMRSAPKTVSYSEYLQLLDQSEVSEVTINGSGNTLVGKYKNPDDGHPKTFVTHFRNEMRPSPEQEARDRAVPLTIEEPDDGGWVVRTLPWLTLIGLGFLVFLFVWRAQSSGGQALSFGRSRHKLVSDSKVKVTFDDVQGVSEAKEELAEVVDYLKYPKKYQKLGARIPKGVLLIGSPGTGKTLLGRAVAGEAGVPFYYISGSDFVEMFVGVGASRVRDLFEQAKKTSPCIIFVDEIDAVGRQRGAGVGGGHDEREQTLNQLLVEMDGFDTTENVIILAATNRPDVLDPALLRPGRFDRRVMVDKPDLAGRLAILKVHSKGKPLSPEVDLKKIARRSSGFSGADLENLLNEAALQAARASHEMISMRDCEEAIDRVLMGPERKSRVLSDQDREETAYHECGHALVARALPESDPVRKVTILPRGRSLGLTTLVPEEESYGLSKKDMLAQICVFMGGRAAEELVFDHFTTGASNDIERATELARDMVCRYGMSEAFGPINLSGKQNQIFLGRDLNNENSAFSESVSRQIDEEVRMILQGQYDRAMKILTQDRQKLDLFAEELVAAESLDDSDLNRILGLSARDLLKSESEQEAILSAPKEAPETQEAREQVEA